jgi:hypothetical protein
MLYEIMASLRLHLSAELPEVSKVQFMHDGVSLTSLTKPFVTIEHLASPSQLVSAGRNSFQEAYSFQIGVFAEDFSSWLKLQETVRNHLRKEVPYYDESLTLTEDVFVCNVTDFTPIRNEDTANVTSDFRGYFDVSVGILRNAESKEFTQ